jgi:hypothetical protein
MTTARTGTAVPAGQLSPDDLAVRVFCALYEEFDLHTAGDTCIAVPKGVPCFIAPTLGEVARQISDHNPTAQPPDTPPGPG